MLLPYPSFGRSLSGGKIADHLLVACEAGDDLTRRMRYFYFDRKMLLLVKDFTIEELSISFDRQLKYQIDPTHLFKQLE